MVPRQALCGLAITTASIPTSERRMRMEDGHIVETPVEARAGFLDRPVLAVLAVSTAVVVVALAMTYLGVVNL
jgi:hypothetical protein